MNDRRDIVEIGGKRLRDTTAAHDEKAGTRRSRRAKFLSIWFRCCHVYGRMHRNRAETAYDGRCPRCGAMVHARIGPGGTSRRLFEAGY